MQVADGDLAADKALLQLLMHVERLEGMLAGMEVNTYPSHNSSLWCHLQTV